MRCPSCDTENAISRKFCRDCGAALAPICAACGARNEPGDRFCGECGAKLAVEPPPPIGTASPPPAATPAPVEAEERRPITALFADIAGFTALSERLDPEDVREITTECFRRLVAEVARLEGTVDKFIGDAVLVLFGAPIAHEDDPARALRAALGMQRALEQFNVELERDRNIRLSLRIGVESGECVVGVRDVGGIREYTAIGDAVNVAARLQAATEPGTILVGPTTQQRTSARFAFERVPALELKGKDQPVAAAILVAERPARHGPVATEVSGPGDRLGRRAPLVGRDAELQSLLACLQDLRRGRGQAAIVVGEPGFGKSRLLFELRSRGQDLHWVRAQAFAHESSVSYGLTRDLVRGLCGLRADERESVAVLRLRARLMELGLTDSFAILAHVLTLPLGEDESRLIAGLQPQDVQRLTVRSVGSLLERSAAGSPLVVELDDLHWADPSSIDLLRELLGLLERTAIMLCCALRPERDAPAWALREYVARQFPHRTTEVLLHQLSESASTELVAGLLRSEQAPPGLRSVLERAAGTPLWLEELILMLVDRGLLEPDGAVWRVTADLDQIDIPDTLQALIISRIDRLGDARPTLQTASVIGRRFGQQVLERIGAGGPRLDEHLRVAQRAELVRELAAVPEREYGFKHVLTQEAAYATLLVRRRRELHRRVADTLVDLYPERLDELHAVLAHHYRRAEAWPEAAHHAELAAGSSRAAFANREAIEQYHQALDAAERANAPAERRLALHEARAAVFETIGDFESARNDYEAALAIAQVQRDPAAEARLLGALGVLWGGHKDYQRGLELTGQAIRIATHADDRRALAHARLGAGIIQLNLAQMAASRRELEAALELFRALNDEPGQARALDVLGMTTFCAGDPDVSEAYAREAVGRLLALGDRATAASSTATVGIALGYLGQRAEAETWLERALAAVTEMGARGGEAYARCMLAEILELFGAYEVALREATIGLGIAREVGHREWMAVALSTLGRIHAACGDLVGARRLHDEMLATARQLGTALWLAQAQSDVGCDLMLAGDPDAASACLAEAVAVGGEALKFTARALLAQTQLSLRVGRPAEAVERARQAQRHIARFRTFALEARRVEGEALAALGDGASAEALLREVKTGAAALGTAPVVWRAGFALASLLARDGRHAEASVERAEAQATLETVAADLTDPELRTALLASETPVD